MKKTGKQLGRLSAEARKPKLVFENGFYKIERIPLNYRIIIKKSLEPKRPTAGIDREYYSCPGNGLEEAHEVAKYIIEEHFKPRIKAILPRAFNDQFKRKGGNARKGL